jgi:hypothetical protein
MRKRTVAKIQKKCLHRFRKPLLYPFELRELNFHQHNRSRFFAKTATRQSEIFRAGENQRLHKLARVQNAVWVERAFDHAMKLA